MARADTGRKRHGRGRREPEIAMAYVRGARIVTGTIQRFKLRAGLPNA